MIQTEFNLNEYINNLAQRGIIVQERTLEAFDQKTAQAVTAIKNKGLEAELENKQIYDYTRSTNYQARMISTRVINEAFIGTKLQSDTALRIQKVYKMEPLWVIADEMLGQYAQVN